MAETSEIIETKRTILVVDSESGWRTKLHELLCREYEVHLATSYSEARDLISRDNIHFDVLITEISLDEKEENNQDGFNLVIELNERGGSTQTIILTRKERVSISIVRKLMKGKGKIIYDLLLKIPENDEEFDIPEFLKIIYEASMKSKTLDVFVLMPFAEEYKDFYEKVIKNTVERMNFVCKRADDFFGPRRIMDDILSYIRDAKFILADFSGRNANVFFEVGIAHALGKSVLLLTQDLEDVPPRLQIIRCLVYESSLAGATRLRTALENTIQEMQRRNYSALFTAGGFSPVLKTCIALMPDSEEGTKTYTDLVSPAITDAGCKVSRSDEIFNSISILDEIWAHINTTEVVVADLSERDADVFYLAGLAYGLEKKVIYLARDPEDIPFDLKAGSHLTYSLNSFSEGIKAQEKLTQLVRNALS